MLARELKSKLKKDGNIKYFISAQTFKGNSYTCEVKEKDLKMLENFQKELLPLILSDNLFPTDHFLENTIIVGMKFNEVVNKEMELVKFVEPFLSYHVDDKEENGKIIQNRIPLKCIKRDFEDYPYTAKRHIEDFQDFLSQVAESSILSEYRQGNLFPQDNPKVKDYQNDFERLEQATKEITGTAAPQEQIEGMQKAADERIKERKTEVEKIGVPVEIKED